jgi:hypothetical protein
LFNNFVLSPFVHVRLLSDGCPQDCIAYLVLHRLWSTISISSLCCLVGTKSRPWSCLRVHCYNSNCFTSFYMINIMSTDTSHVHMLVKNILLSFWIKLYPNKLLKIVETELLKLLSLDMLLIKNLFLILIILICQKVRLHLEKQVTCMSFAQLGYFTRKPSYSTV